MLSVLVLSANSSDLTTSFSVNLVLVTTGLRDITLRVLSLSTKFLMSFVERRKDATASKASKSTRTARGTYLLPEAYDTSASDFCVCVCSIYLIEVNVHAFELKVGCTIVPREESAGARNDGNYERELTRRIRQVHVLLRWFAYIAVSIEDLMSRFVSQLECSPEGCTNLSILVKFNSFVGDNNLLGYRTGRFGDEPMLWSALRSGSKWW